MLTFEPFKNTPPLVHVRTFFFFSLPPLDLTPPCIDSKRLRAYIQNVSVCARTTSKKRDMDGSVSGEVAACSGVL